MRVIFRFDDYSAAEQHSYEVDAALFDLFASLEVPLVVAVTPRMSAAIRDPTNRRFFPIEHDRRRVDLLANGLQHGWQLALHGFTHQSTPALSGTEMRGVPYEKQKQSIAEGLRDLARCHPGSPVDVFIPPWNSYDSLTVRCLSELGIRILCAGDTELPHQQQGVTVVPSLMCPRDLLDYLDAFDVEDLVREVGDGTLVVTVHQYEFRSPVRTDSVRLDALDGAVRQLKAAGVNAGILEPHSPASIYSPHNVSRLKAKIYTLQQMRTGRNMGLWTLARFLEDSLALRRATMAKGIAAQASWQFDQIDDQLRSRFRPLKRWILQRRRRLPLQG